MKADRGQRLPDPNHPELGLVCFACGRRSGYKPRQLHRRGKAVKLIWHHILLSDHRIDACRLLRYQLRDWRLPNGQTFEPDDMVSMCTVCHNSYHLEVRQHKTERLGGLALDEWLEIFPSYGFLMYGQAPPGAGPTKSNSHQSQRRARNRIAARPIGKIRVKYLRQQQVYI